MAGKRDARKCAARDGLTKDEVKAAVRKRDRCRCTKCGLSDADHLEQHGRRLQVHRKTPGGLYRVVDCVLLCAACHGPEPKRPQGECDQENPPFLFVRLPEAHREALARLRKKTRRTATEEVQIALEKYYEQEGIEFPPKDGPK